RLRQTQVPLAVERRDQGRQQRHQPGHAHQSAPDARDLTDLGHDLVRPHVERRFQPRSRCRDVEDNVLVSDEVRAVLGRRRLARDQRARRRSPAFARADEALELPLHVAAELAGVPGELPFQRLHLPVGGQERRGEARVRLGGVGAAGGDPECERALDVDQPVARGLDLLLDHRPAYLDAAADPQEREREHAEIEADEHCREPARPAGNPAKGRSGRGRPGVCGGLTHPLRPALPARPAAAPTRRKSLHRAACSPVAGPGGARTAPWMAPRRRRRPAGDRRARLAASARLATLCLAVAAARYFGDVRRSITALPENTECPGTSDRRYWPRSSASPSPFPVRASSSRRRFRWIPASPRVHWPTAFATTSARTASPRSAPSCGWSSTPAPFSKTRTSAVWPTSSSTWRSTGRRTSRSRSWWTTSSPLACASARTSTRTRPSTRPCTCSRSRPTVPGLSRWASASSPTGRTSRCSTPSRWRRSAGS